MFISLLGKISHKSIHTYVCDAHRPGEKGGRSNTDVLMSSWATCWPYIFGNSDQTFKSMSWWGTFLFKPPLHQSPTLINKWVLLWLLTGAEVIQGQLYHQSPPQHEWQFRNLQHTAQPAGSSTGRRLFFPGTSVGLRLFQAFGLVFASSRWLSWSLLLLGARACLRVSFVGWILWEWLSEIFIVYSWSGRSLVNLIGFRDFLKIFGLFTCCLNELPYRMEC